ncbi:sorting nexin-22 isoform X2 [Onychostruthus taczanowskii]|uniref:sorting nexin-22 isoform X2 n=1 Tax=Onychostruthus taczanowskii TaxID=356909 RepID=UPI001B808221|nr:sorting nexin-22 isoform X2 [Onychostruthus taczanowskii]
MGARGGPCPLPAPLPARPARGPAVPRAMIAVSIPAAEPPAAGSPERAHTVFRVEVLCNGRRHTVTKRYSEFQALHKRIKKTCKVPDLPPRHVPNWMPKMLEQRRQGLELYLQGVLYHNEELPQDILDFLKVQRCQQSPKAGSPPTRLLPSQRPILGFRSDPYVRPHGTELLPNAVLSGVLQGLYLPVSCAPGPAAPRASGMMSSTQHPGMQW